MVFFSPQIDGVIVGFMSGSTDLDMKQLGSIYDLSDFEGLYDVKQQKCCNAAAQFDPTGDEEEQRSSSVNTFYLISDHSHEQKTHQQFIPVKNIVIDSCEC